MDYKKIYDNLIKFCKKRKNPDNVYIELHHIIPESLGGETNKEKIITKQIPEKEITVYEETSIIVHTNYLSEYILMKIS